MNLGLPLDWVATVYCFVCDENAAHMTMSPRPGAGWREPYMTSRCRGATTPAWRHLQASSRTSCREYSPAGIPGAECDSAPRW